LKLAEINLEKHRNLNGIFGTNDLDIIIPELELLARTSLRRENTLLFLDEIQSTPNAIAALRYFREEMPQLPVVAAGSLLEFVLAEQFIAQHLAYRFEGLEPPDLYYWLKILLILSK